MTYFQEECELLRQSFKDRCWNLYFFLFGGIPGVGFIPRIFTLLSYSFRNFLSGNYHPCDARLVSEAPQFADLVS
jgi:hypothetical protein